MARAKTNREILDFYGLVVDDIVKIDGYRIRVESEDDVIVQDWFDFLERMPTKILLRLISQNEYEIL
jgi:uncharacterized cysteine cluster protein YcgN (CxxCxxCC family)